MCNLQAIERVCQGAPGGVKTIFITPTSNYSGDISGLEIGERVWDQADKVYAISFRKGSARYREQPSMNAAGQSWTQTLECSIPGARQSVEELIQALMNVKCHVYYTDWNGFTRYLMDVRFKSSYDSGAARGDANEYVFSFSKVFDRSAYAIAGTVSPGTGSGGGGETPAEVDDTCCLTINPVQLGFVPATSGNTTNLNEIVTASDGSIWIIDKDGRGMRMTRTSGDFEVTNLNKGLVLTTSSGNKRRIRISDAGIPFSEEV